MHKAIRRLILDGPVAITLVVTTALWTLVDAWWFMTPLGYGPRWLWAGLAVVPQLALGVPPTRRLAASVLTLLLVAVGILGWRLPSPALARVSAEAAGDEVRLVSYNAGVGGDRANAMAAHAASLGADIIAIVECGAKGGMTALQGYTTERLGEVCLWSRIPLASPLEAMPREPATIGWSGSTVRASLQIGSDTVPLGIVHLRSVRNELTEFLDVSEIPGQSDLMAARMSKRVLGSQISSAWLRDVPIVVGDFNLVPESRRFRTDWGHLRSSWRRSSIGTGYTWHSRWHGLRIDHILVSPDVQVTKAWVGPDLGSDHRPVIADLILPAR
jgi:vancomycin resistance protein VanJ